MHAREHGLDFFNLRSLITKSKFFADLADHTHLVEARPFLVPKNSSQCSVLSDNFLTFDRNLTPKLHENAFW